MSVDEKCRLWSASWMTTWKWNDPEEDKVGFVVKIISRPGSFDVVYQGMNKPSMSFPLEIVHHIMAHPIRRNTVIVSLINNTYKQLFFQVSQPDERLVFMDVLLNIISVPQIATKMLVDENTVAPTRVPPNRSTSGTSDTSPAVQKTKSPATVNDDVQQKTPPKPPKPHLLATPQTLLDVRSWNKNDGNCKEYVSVQAELFGTRGTCGQELVTIMTKPGSMAIMFLDGTTAPMLLKKCDALTRFGYSLIQTDPKSFKWNLNRSSNSMIFIHFYVDTPEHIQSLKEVIEHMWKPSKRNLDDTSSIDHSPAAKTPRKQSDSDAIESTIINKETRTMVVKPHPPTGPTKTTSTISMEANGMTLKKIQDGKAAAFRPHLRSDASSTMKCISSVLLKNTSNSFTPINLIDLLMKAATVVAFFLILVSIICHPPVF